MVVIECKCYGETCGLPAVCVAYRLQPFSEGVPRSFFRDFEICFGGPLTPRASCQFDVAVYINCSYCHM